MRGTGLRGALESLRRRGGRLDPDEVRQRLARLEAADMGAYGHLEAHAHAVERLDAADRAAFGHLDAHVATIAELRASVEELRVRSDAHSEQLGILHDLLAATAFVAALPPSDTLVSVVIATRDRPELLREAIASVLGQTHGAFEILVADDGSDPPVETAPDPRIRILRSEASTGPRTPATGLSTRRAARSSRTWTTTTSSGRTGCGPSSGPSQATRRRRSPTARSRRTSASVRRTSRGSSSRTGIRTGSACAI